MVTENITSEIISREQSLHLKKVRAGELGGMARAKNNAAARLSAIGKMGGRPRKLTYKEIMLQEQKKTNKRRNGQQNTEQKACTDLTKLRRHWKQIRKEAKLRP